MELNWQNKKWIMSIVAFGIVLYIALQNINVIGGWFNDLLIIFTPFMIGACIAFVVNIPMGFLEKKVFSGKKRNATQKQADKAVNKVKRFFSIIFSLLIIITVLVVLFRLVIPELINVIKNCIQYLTTLPLELKPIIDNLAISYPELREELSKLQIDFSNILNSSIEFLKNAGSGVIGFVGNAISSTISSVANFVVGIIFAFYLLMSKEKIGRAFKRIILAFVPSKYALKILEITSLSKETFTKFITGQLKEAVILGLLCYAGMLILQIPYSLTISLLTMVTALIPIFGALIGATVGVVLLLAISPIKAVTFLIFIIVLQQIETNLIYPKVVGESVGVPGIIVLVAISVGGSLGGMLGMLIALPVVSVIYALLKVSVSKRLKEKNITNIYNYNEI